MSYECRQLSWVALGGARTHVAFFICTHACAWAAGVPCIHVERQRSENRESRVVAILERLQASDLGDSLAASRRAVEFA